MSSNLFLKNKLTELQVQYDLLSEKVSLLRKAIAIDTSTVERFKLEKQLQDEEKERSKIESQICSFEKQIEKISHEGAKYFEGEPPKEHGSNYIHENARINTEHSNYSNIFQVSSLNLPYVVIIGGWGKGINEFRKGEITSKIDEEYIYKLPEDFKINYDRYQHIKRDIEPKCKLLNYNCEVKSHYEPNQLTFIFSKIEYQDYLMSGEHLDDPLPNDPTLTFRNKYAPRLDLHNLGKSALTDICGVGVFIITSDNKIIISKHSKNVQVWSNILSYSASGTMSWNPKLHPFEEVARECYEEIAHKINIDNTYLFGFGIDAKKLYFQFSFFEYTGLTSKEILKKAPLAEDFHAEMDELMAIPFELEPLVSLVKKESWEPAAAVALLTLCTKKFGLDAIEKAVDPKFTQKRSRDRMLVEWELRASRPDDLAVMSARYPYHRCDEESKRYIHAVMDFIGKDVDNKDVLEIGCGTGRLTERLVYHTRKLTCIDICQKMIERNQKRLGSLVTKINYLHKFAQDYDIKNHHDIAISSLVLIHNIDKDDFRQLVNVMSMCANSLFLFEHIDTLYQVSSQTLPKSEEELLTSFHNFKVDRRREYTLFNDNLIFLKLVERNRYRGSF